MVRWSTCSLIFMTDHDALQQVIRNTEFYLYRQCRLYIRSPTSRQVSCWWYCNTRLNFIWGHCDSFMKEYSLGSYESWTQSREITVVVASVTVGGVRHKHSIFRSVYSLPHRRERWTKKKKQTAFILSSKTFSPPTPQVWNKYFMWFHKDK